MDDVAAGVGCTPKQIRNLRGTAVLFKTDGANVKKFFLPNG